jgi:hypothetical protein
MILIDEHPDKVAFPDAAIVCDPISQESLAMQKMFASMITGAAVVCFAAPAFANTVTVTPAGDHFSAASTNATFTLGPVTVNCNHSTTTGSVPATPANHGDPVTTPITPPVFNNGSGNTCPTNLGVNATLAVTGTWSVAINANASGALVGTLIIPKGGVSTSAKLFGQNCTALVAPTAAVSLAGTWVNGTGGGKPKLSFSGSVPVQPGGGILCPSNTSATISVSYDITDTTSSAPTQIVVTTP